MRNKWHDRSGVTHYQESTTKGNNESRDSNSEKDTSSEKRGSLEDWARKWSHAQHMQLLSHHQKAESKMEEVALDSATTPSLFCNKKLVTKIRKNNHDVLLETNTGTSVINQVAKEPLVGEVMFLEDTIANLYALSKFCEKYRVRFDSEKENKF